ncbi:MAG TPA: hypothetical protein VMM78_00270 [Thermomicrobiales bacterium]|nr:hypothetical protein [Thermomicrobiales bacterium]
MADGQPPTGGARPEEDLALLRRHEPILRFTEGELFFPTPADGYVERCSLWARAPHKEPRLLVAAGKLDLDLLGVLGSQPTGTSTYMRFVQRPLSGREYQRWRMQTTRPVFKSRGRLARVGIGARLIDAAFSISLLLRGTVPGGTTAAAMQQYDTMLDERPGYAYYGRVTRDGGYITLQYLYFYVMNDWRSSFYGANDHEADWEQVFVYLDDRDGGEPVPAWVAYASHGYSGDDLRRRWDDPHVAKEEDHPVVFVAAGSHAAYFEAGEYLTRVEAAFLRPLLNVIHRVERIWRVTLQQGDSRGLSEGVQSLIGVPFVEYARGDGVAIGAGQASGWNAILMPGEGWVERYRGLWGLDTRDPFPAERAPTGPKFNHTGTIRQTWHDPLGWSGIGTVAPPGQAERELREHIVARQEERQSARAEVELLRAATRGLELEARAIQQGSFPASLYRARSRELELQEARLDQLQQRVAQLDDSIRASEEHLARIEAGDLGDPQAHMRHSYRPETPREFRIRTLAEAWSAVSIGLLLLGIALLVIPGIARWSVAFLAAVAVFVTVESLLHQRLLKLTLNVTIILAVITSGILLYEFFFEIAITLVVTIALLLILENVRELFGNSR